MPRFTVDARGIKEAEARLRALKDTAPVERALDAAAALVERSAVKRMPVDTGEMRTGMYVERPAPLKRVVGNWTRYAVFTEYSQRLLRGHSADDPRKGPWPYRDEGKTKGTKAGATMPWLRPALAENRERIRDLIERALRGTDHR